MERVQYCAPVLLKGVLMKSSLLLMSLVVLLVTVGCQGEATTTTTAEKTPPAVTGNSAPVTTTQVVNQTVEASCGQCKFDMKGKDGCDLAVRIDGKAYFVDGSGLDDHGDAHGDDGLCNCIRQATVTGEIKDGRFVSTAFELLPLNKDEDK